MYIHTLHMDIVQCPCTEHMDNWTLSIRADDDDDFGLVQAWAKGQHLPSVCEQLN